jgi:large subunit ribosomal protein L16
MLSPKRTKYRKKQRGKIRRKATRGNKVAFGEFGLVAMEPKWVTNRQLEAGRVALTRHIKRGGKVWIRVFPDMPYTQKPAETRMGKGKGNPEYWVAVVEPGRVIFEVGGIDRELAHEAMKLAGSKLSIKTRFVEREELGG